MTAKIEQQYVGVLSSIPYYYEIFLPFFEKYNIIANWTDCHNTFVLCDNETGKDTFSHQVFRKNKSCFRTKFGNVFAPNLSRFDTKVFAVFVTF